MDAEEALVCLAALSNGVRLRAFRLLLKQAPHGATTGHLVEALGLPQSTCSSHLAVLVSAGLVRAEKAGRNKIQHADTTRAAALIQYLTEECCDGRPGDCGFGGSCDPGSQPSPGKK